MQRDTGDKGDPNFMESLARGLAVMECLAESERPLTIADVGRGVGISRAAAARCLYTLATLGYVRQDHRGYVVHRRALALGTPYVTLNALITRAQPCLDRLRNELGESCSLGVIEDDQLVYAARAEANRIMSVGLRVGSRLPLYPTSMGRVLLAGLPVEDREAYLARAVLTPLTPKTVVDKRKLLKILEAAALEGHAIVDQELELGVRSVAVPVTAHGRVIAALNAGVPTSRVSIDDLRQKFLPIVQSTSRMLSS
jgi:IclR family pca regulon transcriptional regulator